MTFTRTTGPRIAATAAVLAGLTLTLAACGGGNDGVYFDEDGKLTVEGTTITFHDFDCPDTGTTPFLEAEPSAVGTLNEDGTAVMWSSDDEHISRDSVGGSMAFTVEEFGDRTVVKISDGDDEWSYTSGSEEDAIAAKDGYCG